mmetsp:Transcript_37915/g.101000  ORF Transcript_37915/g.101000 Transcript_37915/m.101000 type:complete len:204 (-) Transcript_37915:1391-2002(-)
MRPSGVVHLADVVRQWWNFMGGPSHGGFAWSRLGLALGRLAAHLSQIHAVGDTPCGAAHRAVSSRDESAKRSRRTVVSEEANRGSDWMSIMERCRGPLLEELTRHTPETTKRPNHVFFHSHDAFRATQGSRGLSNTNVVSFCLWVLYLAHRLELLVRLRCCMRVSGFPRTGRGAHEWTQDRKLLSLRAELDPGVLCLALGSVP